MEDIVEILEDKLKNSLDYKEKVEILLKLAKIFNPIDFNKSISYVNEAIAIALEHKDDVAYAKSLIVSAESYVIIGENKMAFELLQKIEPLSAIIDDGYKGEMLFCYGVFHFNLLEYEKAHHYFMQALQIYKVANLLAKQPQILNALAVIHKKLNAIDTAIKYYEEALSISTSENFNSTLYNNIGNIYVSKNNFEEAEKYLLKSLKLKKEFKLHAQLPYTYISLFNMCLAKKDIIKARIYHNDLLGIVEGVNHFEVKMVAKMQAIRLMILDDKLDSAEELSRELIDFIGASEIKNDLEEAYGLAIDVYKKKGNFKAATEHYENLISIKERKSKEDAHAKIEKAKLSSEMELVKKQNEIERFKNEEINSSLRYAKRIQNASMSEVSDFDNKLTAGFFYFESKDIVGGDFFFTYSGGNFSYFAVADCTGHGVPGALLSMLGSGLLRQIVLSNIGLSPNLILEKMHKQIQQSLKKDDGDAPADGMDMALIKIDFNKKILEYSGANRPLILFKKGELIEIKPDKNCLGGIDPNEARVFTNHFFDIEEGNRIYMYSDGIVDQFGGEKKKKFGTARLKEFILETIRMGNITKDDNRFFDMMRAWKGNVEQTDDITVMGIEIKRLD